MAPEIQSLRERGTLLQGEIRRPRNEIVRLGADLMRGRHTVTTKKDYNVFFSVVSYVCNWRVFAITDSTVVLDFSVLAVDALTLVRIDTVLLVFTRFERSGRLMGLAMHRVQVE